MAHWSVTHSQLLGGRQHCNAQYLHASGMELQSSKSLRGAALPENNACVRERMPSLPYQHDGVLSQVTAV